MGFAKPFSPVSLCVTPWTVVTRFLCPWDFPGKNTGVAFHFLLQRNCPAPRIFFFFNFSFFLFILIRGYLLYNIVVVFAIHWYESAMGVHVLPILNPLAPPSPSHPSGSSQCTSPEHPASCIEPGLVICFTWYYTCFNVILSNHPTLAFSHRVQKTVLYICVSFAVSH